MKLFILVPVILSYLAGLFTMLAIVLWATWS